MNLRTSQLCRATLLAGLSCAAALAAAGEPSVVRLAECRSDAPAAAPAPVNPGCRSCDVARPAPAAAGCRDGVCRNGGCRNGQCRNGNCQNGACRNGAGGACNCQNGNGRNGAGCNCRNGNGRNGAGGLCYGNGHGVGNGNGNCPAGNGNCRNGNKGLLGGLMNMLGMNGNGCSNGMCGNCNGKKKCGMVPVDPCYCDPRDLELYSAQGYNVPVAVPLPPVVRSTYNYGWGVPSSRLIRVGARYTQNQPEVPFTQSGGRLPGGQYPMVYQPTDTTQTGFYYVNTPRWMPWGNWCW